MRKFFITGLWTGYLPIAPGTWGSAGASVVFLLVAWLSCRNLWAVNLAMATVAVLSTLGCLAWGGYAEKVFGRKDPSQVTLDEWAGQAVSYLLLPLGAGWMGLAWPALVGFLLFRVMDIIKPPPANGLQKLKGGSGIVVDDLIAGVYANLVSQLVLRLVIFR